jgi:hypothetical protein
VGDISALADGIGDLRFGLFSFATPRSARVIWGAVSAAPAVFRCVSDSSNSHSCEGRLSRDVEPRH